ncbi:unnamed protein product [Heterobilharzia americana]|nr:unnamed protein product [Heterobilharzia americana]
MPVNIFIKIHQLIVTFLFFSLRQKEFIAQLIDEQLHRLATSSLTKSMAMSLYDYSLIKRCFNRFHYVIWKREEVIQHQILLNTMPTPVGADCLPLRLMTVNNQIKSNMEQFKLSCNLSSGIDKHSSHVENKSPLLVNSMTSRFLPEISKVSSVS